MPQEVLDVTTKFMRDPVRILVKKEELTLEGIRQFYINVEREVRELLLKYPHVNNDLCLVPSKVSNFFSIYVK